MKKKQPENEKNEQYVDAKSKQGTSKKEMSAKFPEPNRGSFQRNSSKRNSSRSGNNNANRVKGKSKSD